MSLTKTQVIIIGGVGLIIIVLGLILTGAIPGLKTTNPQVVSGNLEVWTLFDNETDLQTILTNFRQAYPKVTVNFRTFSDPEEYENKLLDALASGTGPDVFMIRNSNRLKYENKIFPLAVSQVSLAKIQELFPDVVVNDFTDVNATYALPLSIDTLALFYNRDMLGEAGIAIVPKTWEELQAVIPRLVTTGAQNKITQAAAALGGSGKSISQASDILSLLMLQNGVKLVNEDLSSAQFASDWGENALNFYAQFSNPASQNYTWNDGLGNDLDAFSQEKVAMIFNYSSAREQIKSRNEFLNFGIGPMLKSAQAKKNISFPDYWGYTVSRQSKSGMLGWTFILYLTTDPKTAEAYLTLTKKPPALRTLINKYMSDPDIGVFAAQILTAKSWPEPDANAVSKIFSDAILAVITGRLTARSALEQAQNQVTQLMQK